MLWPLIEECQWKIAFFPVRRCTSVPRLYLSVFLFVRPSFVLHWKPCKERYYPGNGLTQKKTLGDNKSTRSINTQFCLRCNRLQKKIPNLTKKVRKCEQKNETKKNVAEERVLERLVSDPDVPTVLEFTC